MTTSTTVPVHVTPEAQARIDHLGFQAEVDRMLDYGRRNLPELDRIEITLYDCYELGDEPGLAIDAYTRRPYDANDQTEAAMTRWEVTEFPPEVLQHIIMCYRWEDAHAG